MQLPSQSMKKAKFEISECSESARVRRGRAGSGGGGILADHSYVRSCALFYFRLTFLFTSMHLNHECKSQPHAYAFLNNINRTAKSCISAFLLLLRLTL